MRLGAYVLLMFAVSAVFYFLGYKPIALESVYSNQGGDTFTESDIFSKLTEGALSPGTSLAAVVAAIAIAFAATLVAGYAAIYIIPIAILILLFNYLIFPFSFVLDPATPDIIKLPVVALMNILMIMSFLSFARGGNV